MRPARRKGLLGAVILAAAGVTLSARGAAAETSAAGALLKRGEQLMAAHRYDQACPKFQQSLSLEPSQVSAYLLGDCLEHLGNDVEATKSYQAVLSARGARSGHLERAARRRLQALAPRIGKLTVAVPSRLRSLDGLQVSCDGDAIDPASWGAALAVSPGSHAIEATAEGHRPWHTSVQIAGGASVSVSIGPLPDEKVAEGSPSHDASESGSSTDGPPDRSSGSSSSSGGAQRAWGVVTGVLGVGAAVAGGVFLGTAYAKNDDIHQAVANGECAGMCDANVTNLASERDRDATIGIVGLSAGGALLVTGAILFFSAPSGSQEDAPKAAQGPRVTGIGLAGLSGLRLSGTW